MFYWARRLKELPVSSVNQSVSQFSQFSSVSQVSQFGQSVSSVSQLVSSVRQTLQSVQLFTEHKTQTDPQQGHEAANAHVTGARDESS